MQLLITMDNYESQNNADETRFEQAIFTLTIPVENLFLRANFVTVKSKTFSFCFLAL